MSTEDDVPKVGDKVWFYLSDLGAEKREGYITDVGDELVDILVPLIDETFVMAYGVAARTPDRKSWCWTEWSDPGAEAQPPGYHWDEDVETWVAYFGSQVPLS